MPKRKSKHLLLLFMQIAITLLYFIAMIHILTILLSEDRWDIIIDSTCYISLGILLIIALVPQIVLRLKKKIHSQDGEIYPLLFMILSLQASLIIPQYTSITGIFLLDSSTILIIERFSVVGSAAIFLLSALRFYGLASSRIPLYTGLILGGILILSILAPINSNSQEYVLFSSIYDAYLQLTTLLLYSATIATMVITAFKDRTIANVKRCISFFFFIAGLILSATAILVPVICSIACYILGIIALVSSTQESF